MDDADRAKEVEQIPIDLAIAAARASTADLAPCGVCYYCDADCRDDHERLARAEKIAGKRQ